MPDNHLKRALLQLPTQILNDLSAGKPPHQVGDALCHFAENLMPGRIASIMVMGADGLLSVFSAPSAPAQLVEDLNGLKPGPHAGSCGNVIYQGKPVMVCDVGQDARWDDLRDLANDWKLQSCWSYPVWCDDKVVGTFALAGSRVAAPDRHALEVLDFCAAMATMLLRYSHIHDREVAQSASLSRALQFNAMLAQVNQVIATTEDAHSLFTAVCEVAVQYGQIKLACIAVPDSHQRFRFLASAGETGYLEDLFVSTDPAIPEGLGSMGCTWRARRAHYNSSFDDSVVRLSPWRDRAKRFGLEATATLPIMRGETVKALFCVYHAQPGVFDGDLQKLLEELALNVSRGLERIFLRRRVEHEQAKQRYLTINDPLTDLPNRLALDQHMPGALARTRKDNALLAFCLADVDDFKNIADRYGNEAGDLVLRTLGRRLRGALRETDLVARSGGDEFVMVVEGLSSPTDLLPQLDRWHEVVLEPITLATGQQVQVEFSMGITFYPEDNSDGGQLMRHAFEAMSGLKSDKTQRSSWWQIWGEENLRSEKIITQDIKPYGAEARALLGMVHDTLTPLVVEFMQQFLQTWSDRPSIADIVGRLDVAETGLLVGRLKQHALLLVRPDLSQQEHRRFSQAMGRVNTLVGLDHILFIEATQAFSEQIRRGVNEVQGMRLRDRQRILDVMAARLRVELQSEIEGLQQLLTQRQSWLAQQSQHLAQATHWVDACTGFLEAIPQLQGFVAAVLSRLDPAGRLDHEYRTALIEHYIEALERLDEHSFLGPVQVALPAEQLALQPAHMRLWQSEQIETNASYARDPRLSLFRSAALNSGIRSAAFIPIVDAQGRIAASLAVFGRHPGQFESTEMRMFLGSLGYMLSQARQRLYRPHPQVLLQSAQQRLLYRDCLEQGRLVMLYQPVVNLRTGHLVKVEALARLTLPDGALVSPALFLPGFGGRELTMLFQRGLDQALERLRDIMTQQTCLSVSLNVPPVVLLEPRCLQWVEQALWRHQLPARQLELEILEDEEFHDLEVAHDTLRQLSALGVGLAMDDLGAGYSSLVRLRNLPFTAVKIDQGLVREVAKDPERVIDFISGLVRLCKSLKLRVLVEGLESQELVEVASLLGADEGQGYALGYPMPVEDLSAWIRDFRWQMVGAAPSTALGRMAVGRG